MHKSRFFRQLSIEDGLALMGDATIRLDDVWNDRPLFIYGAGNLGRLAAEFLDAVGCPANRTIERKDLAFGVDRAMRIAGPRVAVAVIASPYGPIERELHENDFEDVVPFYDLAWDFRAIHPLGDNGWFAEPFTAHDRGKIAEVWDRWEDDRSRAHHLQFLAWRRLREEWTFARAPVSNDDRYFIPEVVAALHDHETFLDGGAYHGDVSRRFAEIVHGRYAHIEQIEPSGEVFLLVAPSFVPEGDGVVGRTRVGGFALGSWNGVTPFQDGFGYASRLGNVGGRNVAISTIDSLDVAPTFIKLHLEGGELDALRGCKATLENCRPIIAATVYHNADGIWRTADWLMSNLENYRFLFRNHCWQAAGAVVYAIPRERKQ